MFNGIRHVQFPASCVLRPPLSPRKELYWQWLLAHVIFQCYLLDFGGKQDESLSRGFLVGAKTDFVGCMFWPNLVGLGKALLAGNRKVEMDSGLSIRDRHWAAKCKGVSAARLLTGKKGSAILGSAPQGATHRHPILRLQFETPSILSTSSGADSAAFVSSKGHVSGAVEDAEQHEAAPKGAGFRRSKWHVVLEPARSDRTDGYSVLTLFRKGFDLHYIDQAQFQPQTMHNYRLQIVHTRKGQAPTAAFERAEGGGI